MSTRYDTLAQSLTVPQIRALQALSAGKFQTAATLGVNGNSLLVLAELGLADKKVYREQSSNPRALVSNERVIRSYRITGKGLSVLRSANIITK